MTWQESILLFSVGLLISAYKVNKIVERKNNWPDSFERETLKCLDILNQDLKSEDDTLLSDEKRRCLRSEYVVCIQRGTDVYPPVEGYILKQSVDGPSCLYDVKWSYHDGTTPIAS